MSKTIEGIPEYFTRAQYLSIFEAAGVDPRQVSEFRMAFDGVHAIVFALDRDGHRIVDMASSTYQKHRIFIPVRDDVNDTTKTTRITQVKD